MKKYFSLGKNFLFPICRSLTGYGVKKTLGIIKKEFPKLKIRKVKSGTKMGLLGAAHGDSTFIAVGNAGNIITSPDGAKWRKKKAGTKKHLRGATYGDGKYVMVGNGGTIFTSPDSTTWTKSKSGTSRHLRRVFFKLLE